MELVKQETDIRELQGNSPHSLISQALAQNASIDTLERLMDLQERYEKQQAKKTFLMALTNFQSEVPEIYKIKKSHSGKYADLSQIKKTIQPFLKENGLSYRWEFEQNEKIVCFCVVSHIDGHSEKSRMEAGADGSGNKSDIHALGSTRTYLERYTLVAALGLTSVEEDDDGQTSKTGKAATSEIPEPKEKINWAKLIRNCDQLEELKKIWKRMSKSEQSENKEEFTKIKGNIEAASKNETIK